MAVKYTNNASSTITSAINSSVTTITLATGEGAEFPVLSVGDYFYGTLVDAAATATEIVKVTGRSTDTLTVVRGQDNTSAAAWGAGTRFDLRVTAALLTDLSPVKSVAGRTGDVTLTKSDVGLGNVDNTADASKPISTATQTALDAKQPLDADLTSIAGLAGTSGLLKKTAANTWALDTTSYLTGNQSISFSGDATGSGTTSVALTLANSGATAGTYRSVTVDAKGRVTGGSNPTTLSGYGITDAQALDADLTAIAALAGTSGLLKKTAANTWTLDTSTYLTSAVTSVSGTAPIVSSGGNTPAISISAATTLASGSMSAADKSKLDGIASGATANTGTVTSVAVTVPTGLSVSGTPITSSGTFAISLAAGYSIPTTSSQTNWDTAYTDRNKWDGGATGLTAATGRTSLGLGTAAVMTGPSGTIVGTTDSQTLTNKTIGMAGPLDCNNNVVQEIKTATFNSQTTLATTSGAITIDWSSAQNQLQAEPTGSITYTFTAPPGPCHLQLIINSDGTSTAQTITWPGSVTWMGATWAGVNNKKAVINFWYDGANYIAVGTNQV